MTEGSSITDTTIARAIYATATGHRWGSRVELEDGSVAEVGQKHNGREVEQISIQTVDGKDDNAVVMYEEGPSSQPTKIK